MKKQIDATLEMSPAMDWADFPEEFKVNIDSALVKKMLTFISTHDQLDLKWLFIDLVDAPDILDHSILSEKYKHFNDFIKLSNIRLIGGNEFRFIFPNRYGSDILESEPLSISELLSEEEIESIKRELPVINERWSANNAYWKGFKGSIQEARNLVNRAISDEYIADQINVAIENEVEIASD